jgi:hypothetical protein
MATASTELPRLPPISTLSRPILSQHNSAVSENGEASLLMLPSPNPGSGANPRLRHLVGSTLAIHSRTPSASSANGMANGAPLTPVFIPPLSGRRPPEPSPVNLDGRSLSRSEPAPRKRTASAAGLPPGQARSDGELDERCAMAQYQLRWDTCSSTVAQAKRRGLFDGQRQDGAG